MDFSDFLKDMYVLGAFDEADENDDALFSDEADENDDGFDFVSDDGDDDDADE